MAKRWTRVAAMVGLAAALAGCGNGLQLGTNALATGADALAQAFKPISPNLPKAEGKRAATFFSYIAMDDKLTPFAVAYLKALELSTSPKIHNVAFADFQGPDSSFMFSIVPSKDTKKLESPMSFLRPDWKEVQANDPAVLATTTNWAFSNHQGDFKAMEIFAHGGGYLGLGTDEHQPGLSGQDAKQIMSVKEVGDALRRGLKGRKLDFMNMLSCLMASVEYAYELRDVTEVLLASEDSIMATQDSTVEMTALLNQELAKPGVEAKALGRRMAIAADAKNPNKGYLTVSAIETARLDEVRRTVNVLAKALSAALKTNPSGVAAAYDGVPTMQHDSVGQRDLWSFCNLVMQKVPSAKDEAVAVKAALKKALIHTRDRESTAANGLAIMMPPRGNLAGMLKHPLIQAVAKSKFHQGTGWDELLAQIAKLPAAPAAVPGGNAPVNAPTGH